MVRLIYTTNEHDLARRVPHVSLRELELYRLRLVVDGFEQIEALAAFLPRGALAFSKAMC